MKSAIQAILLVTAAAYGVQLPAVAMDQISVAASTGARMWAEASDAAVVFDTVQAGTATEK